MMLVTCSKYLFCSQSVFAHYYLQQFFPFLPQATFKRFDAKKNVHSLQEQRHNRKRLSLPVAKLSSKHDEFVKNGYNKNIIVSPNVALCFPEHTPQDESVVLAGLIARLFLSALILTSCNEV